MLISKRIGIIMGLLAIMLFVIGCSEEPTQSSDNDSKREESSSDSSNDTSDTESIDSTEASGGILKIALDAQPPSLDPTATTASATRETSRLVFETLLTVDSKFKVVPMLAESVEESEIVKLILFT